jgi:thiamine biosynthesis lipoprotein
MDIQVLHQDLRAGGQAIDAAFTEVSRVERVMSIYQADSQLSRLNRENVLRDPDPYLVEVLTHAREMAERSGGAFDVTVQPLWKLYADAAKAGELPEIPTIELCRMSVDWRGVSISPREIRIRMGQAITLNGIAQGFAADRAMATLRSHGVQHALVNAGELSASGKPWTVGIQHPRQPDAYIAVADLAGRCMSTSGDYQTSFSADRAYNHIFDPSTGRSPAELASVTVVAPTATLADALSTAIFVLGPDRGTGLAKSLADVDVLLVLKDGTTLKTDGFPLHREVSDA